MRLIDDLMMHDGYENYTKGGQRELRHSEQIDPGRLGSCRVKTVAEKG